MKYKIITQNGICILTLSGDISREDKETIITCTNEIKSVETDSVVIYFKNISSIDPQLHRELTLLQHELRKNNKRLKVVGLNLQLKTLLAEKGVIRSNEMGVSLEEVLSSLGKT